LILCQRCLVIRQGAISFDGKSEDGVQNYLNSDGHKDKYISKNVIYESETDLNDFEIAKITKIEMLDNFKKPKFFVDTWDEVIFRIHYNSKETFTSGSFVLDISDFRQNRLIAFDSGNQAPIIEGEHFVDCLVPRLPLSSGEYYIGGGLTMSNAGFIDKYRNDLGMIIIHAKDVFNLGRPPDNQRMVFAVEHIWKNSQ